MAVGMGVLDIIDIRHVHLYLRADNIYKLEDVADYDTNDAPKQQAVWLDDLPVGLLANSSQWHYIEPDRLGSPVCSSMLPATLTCGTAD